MNKKKISREILGLTGLSLIIAVFFFVFFRVLANGIVISYVEKTNMVLTEAMEQDIKTIIFSVTIAAAAIIFVFLSTFLVGERIEETVEGLQKEREGFIRGLSHDIRTPLTAILSYSELLQAKQDVQQSEIQDYLSMVQRKATQMKSLTEQLLDGGERNLEKIDSLYLFMEQLADEWESALETSYNCSVEIVKFKDCSSEFDIREMRRVIDNLVSNIERYADAERPVSLKIYQEDENIVLFQKNTRKSNMIHEESRGIGLESIRKIAETYGGGMEVVTSETEFSAKIFFRIL